MVPNVVEQAGTTWFKHLTTSYIQIRRGSWYLERVLRRFIILLFLREGGEEGRRGGGRGGEQNNLILSGTKAIDEVHIVAQEGVSCSRSHYNQEQEIRFIGGGRKEKLFWRASKMPDDSAFALLTSSSGPVDIPSDYAFTNAHESDLPFSRPSLVFLHFPPNSLDFPLSFPTFISILIPLPNLSPASPPTTNPYP